jgi:uncharacterized protein YdaT
MSLDKILSIGGKPGLYKLITQTRTGLVAQALLDGKKISVSIANNISVLSEIAIYTLDDELPLREVFQKISKKENGGKTAITAKADKLALEEYFFEILPGYDEDRVYPSDIKKVIQWYNLLVEHDLADFSDPKANTDMASEISKEDQPPKKESPKKGTSQKGTSQKGIPQKATPKKVTPKLGINKKGTTKK